MLHFDGYSMNQGVESMVQLILELSQHKLEGRLVKSDCLNCIGL